MQHTNTFRSRLAARLRGGGRATVLRAVSAGVVAGRARTCRAIGHRAAVCVVLSCWASLASAAGVPPTASHLQFNAALDGAWRFERLTGACELSQTVPDFGRLRFLRRAGRPLEFIVESVRELFAPGAIRVGVASPDWHPRHPERRAVRGQPHEGGPDVAVSDPHATQLLMALHDGLEPTVHHMGWFAEDAQLTVRASSARFAAVYETFVSCFADLMPATWEEIERSSLNYPTDGWQVTAKASERLALVARYIDADPAVGKVYIDGHTDNSGGPVHNQQLSKRRAQTVAARLRELGIAPDRLVVRYHGARYPVADNSDPAGRQRNRRTTIRMERGAETVAVR